MSKTNCKSQMGIEITKRDRDVLYALWKWKILSTQALATKFFSKTLFQSAYRRIARLAQFGFIKPIEIERRRNDGWTLDQKGYKYLRQHLGDLRSEGFKSEYPDHDHFVTAFHLGDWLIDQPEYTQIYSEQQLRRVPVDLWPDWLIKSDSHRPDGYSLYFEGDNKILVGFEVELSVKSKKRYESVVAFYDTQDAIKFVFWLVKSKNDISRLKSIFQSFHVRDWSKHHFLLISDFKKYGWNASFVEGKFLNRTPASFLLQSVANVPPMSRQRNGVSLLLDFSKKYIISSTSKTCLGTQKP